MPCAALSYSMVVTSSGSVWVNTRLSEVESHLFCKSPNLYRFHLLEAFVDNLDTRSALRNPYAFKQLVSIE